MKRSNSNGKEAYSARMSYLKEHPKYTEVLHAMNRIFTYLVFALYPLLVVWLFLYHKEMVSRVVIIPLDSFIILSVARYLINRKRPYEFYETPAAVIKNTKGKSFPSRHVFSAFVIAITFLYAVPNPWVGISLLMVGVLLAALRVILGVHFVSDVVVGAICGILFAVVGYVIW